MCFIAQELIVLNDSLPSTKGIERNPTKLVNKLIEGKNTDKEKFDVIFSWVAHNIRYNYYSYLAPTGSAYPRIDKILKHKSGICIDYAYLMDTLCKLAGIKNISIYGYVKDNLFDVNDSIYMDNHAWNAVKLDRYWYVYDVTWSSGQYFWDYTKFSKLLLRLRKKIRARAKEKVIKLKIKWVTECRTYEDSVKFKSLTYSKKDKFFLEIIYKFKLHRKLTFKKLDKLNYYYLTNPEVLSITHFPDNPYWSLSITKENIKDFEKDSSYYHLNDSIYMKQLKMGRTCMDCDNYFSLSEMNKEKQMKKNSLDFNPRNMFVSWLCNYNIANLYYEEAIPENDSLKKVSLIDSSLAYLSNARNDLYQCLRNVMLESELQKSKNKNKDEILYEENKKHINIMYSVIKDTYEKTRKMNYFVKQITSHLRKYRKKIQKLEKESTPFLIKSKDFRTKEAITLLENNLNKTKIRIDSLDQIIDFLNTSYNKLLNSLSENLSVKNRSRDSLSSSFLHSTNLRSIYLADNYKKTIVEVRKKIEKYEEQYISGLNDKIFIPSDSCAEIGFRIMELINKRNELIIESIKLSKTLVKENIISFQDFKNYVSLNRNKIQENICWILGGSSRLNYVLNAYEALVKNEEYIEKIIRSEILTETMRYKLIDKEILRRKRKSKSVPKHNLIVTSNRKMLVTKYKREYLKSLKELRREQKKDD